MYDVDGNGVIDIQEMTKIVQVSVFLNPIWEKVWQSIFYQFDEGIFWDSSNMINSPIPNHRYSSAIIKPKQKKKLQ